MKHVLKNPANLLVMLVMILTMAFTFSCSDNDKGDDNNGGSNAGGGGFNENSPSQAYNEDGSKFEASGNIEAEFCDENYICEYITIGSIAGGLAKLQLPPTVDGKYLSDVTNVYSEEKGCTVSQKDAKVVGFNYFRLDDDYLEISYIGDGIFQTVRFFYYSKATKITCTREGENEKDGKYSHKVNIDAKEGWNKVYYVKNNSNDGETTEYSTNNILTKEVGWLVFKD